MSKSKLAQMNMFGLFCPDRSQKYIQFHIKENKAHVTSDRIEMELFLGTLLIKELLK